MFGEGDRDWERDQLYKAVRSGLPMGLDDEHRVTLEICRRVTAMVLEPLLVRIAGLEKALLKSTNNARSAVVREIVADVRPSPRKRTNGISSALQALDEESGGGWFDAQAEG